MSCITEKTSAFSSKIEICHDKLKATTVITNMKEKEIIDAPLAKKNKGTGDRGKTEMRTQVDVANTSEQLTNLNLAAQRGGLRKPKFIKKVILPVNEHSILNFFNIIFGPSGGERKEELEAKIGCKIIISDQIDVSLLDGDSEPVQVTITGDGQKSLDAAVNMIEQMLANPSFDSFHFNLNDSSTKCLLRSFEEDECAENEISFLSDAEGNGSVAKMIGGTFDFFANAIDEMVVELDRSDSADNNNKGEENQQLEDKKNELFDNEEEKYSTQRRQNSSKALITNNVTDFVTEGEDECGATTLESKKSAHADVTRPLQEDSAVIEWQVVNNKKMNSCNLRQEENISTLTACSVSTTRSVPTKASSDFYSGQVDYFCYRESQIKYLMEIGFDRNRCENIIEKIEIANIESGTPEKEIIVAQVVDELLK